MFGKVCLVLGGGGARGSYQIGFFKALEELSIKFDAIIGTSVGALNGAMVCSKKFDVAIELWKNMTLDQIVVSSPLASSADDDNGEIHQWYSDILLMMSKLQKLVVEDKGLDTQPLLNILEKHVDEKKIRESGIDFGIVTYDISSLSSGKFFLEDIEEGLFHKYILASASLPGFKSTRIGDKVYVDGGLSENTPINLAKERGYKNIIAVELVDIISNKRPNISGTNITYIKHSYDIGTVLDFSKERLHRNIRMGYLDTLKVFGVIDGIKYFYRINYEILDIFNNLLYSKSVFDQYKYVFDKNKTNHITHKKINELLEDTMPIDYKKYSPKFIVLLEMTMKFFNIEPIEEHGFKDIIKKLWEKLEFLRKNPENIDTLTKIFNKTKHGRKFNIFDEDFVLPENLELFLFLDEENEMSVVLNKNFHYFVGVKIFYFVLRNYFEA